MIISFNSGKIIPPDLLTGTDYNFHAGPPEYPGRDPHHWAVYDGAEEFGVTCHIMTEKVDAGPIVAVRRFPMVDDPQELRVIAHRHLIKLFSLLTPQFLWGSLPTNGERWGSVKRTRADLLRMCEMPFGLTEEEQDRRRRAFNGFDVRTVFDTKEMR